MGVESVVVVGGLDFSDVAMKYSCVGAWRRVFGVKALTLGPLRLGGLLLVVVLVGPVL